jgi:hypothetical protein
LGKNESADEIMRTVQFDQIKEMLFYMDGLSYSDEEMVKVIQSNGGVTGYFNEVKERYKIFISDKK